MSIRYTVKQTFSQIARNKTMGFISFASIMAMLVLIGAAFVLVVNLAVAMERAKDGYDEILIHLEDERPIAQAAYIISELNAMPEVQSATFLSKDEALENWRVAWGDRAYLLDTLQTNPLPDGIIVKLRDLESADAVVARARGFDYILEVQYYRDVVDALMRISNGIQTVSFIIIIFLIIISTLIVSNTIKLTVHARSEEISIMKNIGATNWFIRGPFLLEGIVIGVAAAAFATGLITLAYTRIIEFTETQMINLFMFQLVPMEFLVFNLLFIFLALGVGIGVVGSIISMRRFLDT